MVVVRYAIVALLAQVVAFSAVRATEPNERPADPGALIRRIASAYAQEMHGIVGLRTHTELVVDGPMLHRKTPSSPWYVYEDGAQVSSSESADSRRPLVHDALRTTYLSEYRYSFADCARCESGEIAVAYESSAQDAFHAHGYFVVDSATERVRRSVEIPYKLPWPTQYGSLEVTWGDAGKDWLPISMAGTFSGKVGPFSGTAHYTQLLSPYERFSDLATATAALTAQTGATPAPAGPPNDARP